MSDEIAADRKTDASNRNCTPQYWPASKGAGFLSPSLSLPFGLAHKRLLPVDKSANEGRLVYDSGTAP